MKAFDGRCDPDARRTATAGGRQTDHVVRKAGEPPEAAPQPEGEETAAARMQTQNNLKQIGLGAH